MGIEEESDFEGEEVSQQKKQRGGQQKKKAGGNGKKKEVGGKPSDKNSTNHSDNYKDKLIDKYRPIQEEMIQNSPNNMVNFPERSNRQYNLRYYFYTEELMALKSAFDNQGDPVKKSRAKKPFKQGIRERVNEICKHLSKDLKKCIIALENKTATTQGGVPYRNKYMEEETRKWMDEFKQLDQQKESKSSTKTKAKNKFYYHHYQELADAIEKEMNNMSLESDSEDRKSLLGLLAYMDEQTYQWEQSITKWKKGDKESYKAMAAQVITPVAHQMTVDGATGKSYLDLGKKGKGCPKAELAVLLHENGQEEMSGEELDKLMEKVDAIGDKLLKNMNLKEG
jgi:hypothetical protein